jgi:hypothetical protein
MNPQLLVHGLVGCVVVGLLGTLGCATTGFQAGEPFSPGEARFFDDGLDLIEDLSVLSGEWAFQAEDELIGRVQLADLVAEVDILAVQLSTDIDGKESRRIDIQVEKILLGAAPGKTISLMASEASKGFITILRNEQRLSGRKLAFVRFYNDEAGVLRSRFHLSPASQALRASVQRRVEQRLREEESARAAAKRR